MFSITEKSTPVDLKRLTWAQWGRGWCGWWSWVVWWRSLCSQGKPVGRDGQWISLAMPGYLFATQEHELLAFTLKHYKCITFTITYFVDVSKYYISYLEIILSISYFTLSVPVFSSSCIQATKHKHWSFCVPLGCGHKLSSGWSSASSYTQRHLWTSNWKNKKQKKQQFNTQIQYGAILYSLLPVFKCQATNCDIYITSRGFY